ncbi:MAG: sigma 54-interacting transcriptional regulator [Alphaproteobacteria bacterium]|nr:sigma 54-interacting transcriptional regulator [Alphaproteobacteria bacterium]
MNRSNQRLLIVDDDDALRSQLKWAFDDFDVTEAQDRRSAIVALRRVEPDVVLLDLGLPPNVHDISEGVRTLEAIQQERPDAKVIIITGQDDRAIARELVGRGAYDFFSKPPDLDEVRLIVSRAFALTGLEAESTKLAEQACHEAIPDLIAQSDVMMALCQKAERAAATDAAVQIVGETGTGKSLLAKAVHDLSSRKDRPFVSFSFAHAEGRRLEAELFGHEKGAFPGATQAAVGKVEQAAGGTLYLHDIGTIEPSLQTKILRLAREQKYERVGGRKTLQASVRVVATANREPIDFDANGTAHAEPVMQVGDLVLTVPPLRDRGQDAALLARHFVRTESKALGLPAKKIGSPALKAIGLHAWPGNVRELQARTKSALVLCTRDVLQPADFDLPEPGDTELKIPTLRQERQRVERELIRQALASSNGKVAEAARMLGISRPTLYELLNTLGIPNPTA